MVSAGTSLALVGGLPLAGSQSRGIVAMEPIAPPSSNLPQPITLPVGNRLMCSGTMSQLTTVPHFPVVASEGSAETSTGDEVTLLPPAVNCSVCDPVPLMPRSPNCATPEASDVAVKLPPSVPLPDAMLAVTSTPAAGLPDASFTSTTGCTDGIEHFTVERGDRRIGGDDDGAGRAARQGDGVGDRRDRRRRR